MSSNQKYTNKTKNISKCAAFVTLLVSSSFLLSIWGLGFIPDKYLFVSSLIIVILNIFLGFIGLSDRVNNLNKIIQIILCILLSLIMITGTILIPRYKCKIENLFIGMQKISELKISMYVLNESEMEKIDQFSDAKIGIHATFDRKHFNEAMTDINRLVENDLVICEYENIFEVVDSLFDGTVDGILLNENFINLIVENEDYSDFIDRTKIVYTVTQKIVNDHKSGFTGIVTKSPFVMLIGGEDTYDYSNIGTDSEGRAIAGNRTDVNMMVIVNPITKQILLVTVPRDSYVPMMGDKSAMDKLTHASVISIDNWEDCVSGIFDYEFPVNFFCRVNFGSLVKIVNAIGGIEVNNPYAFQSISHYVYENAWLVNRSYWYPEGEIYLDGNKALLYVRERMNLPNGDISRNENTARVLKAIIKKCTSPQIMSNIDDLLDTMSGTFVTDMSFKQISSLIKMQVNDMADWDIITRSITGEADWGYSYLLGYQRMMTYLDMNSIESAKADIRKIINNEIIE